MSSAFAGLTLTNLPSHRSAAVARRPFTVIPMASARTPLAPSTGRGGVRGGPYEVLRVKQTASAAEIKVAYRALAKRFHPDVAATGEGDTVNKFLDIRQAYNTLSDPSARAKYDRSIGRVSIGSGAPPLRCRKWETDQCW